MAITFSFLKRLHFPFNRFLVVCLMTGIFTAKACGATVSWICSSDGQFWTTMPAPEILPADPAVPPQVRVASQKTYQTMDGFGGCFNEVGWVALRQATEADRAHVLAGLFGDDGCAFTLARLPIGASDFATNAYSLDDTAGDFGLTNFSLARDEQLLLPYVKAAMAVRPTLQCWGSPWSPPAWMKTNTNYSKGSLQWEPAILQTYANYLARWVEDYRKAGVSIYAVCPQNEPNILNNYPTCLWTGPQLREFIADYLGPTLRARKTSVELWLGTLNGDPLNGGDNANDRLVTVLEDPKANAFVTGVTFQYDSHNLIGSAYELYPGKKLMQSETECNRGLNSWADAQRLYRLMKRYIENGAGSYFAWNMVLDETGMSTWNWRQNALVTVNRQTGQVTFNGEYYVLRHFSQFVKPGARRALATGPWSDKIAFVNPDGSTVLVLGNWDKQSREAILSVAGRSDGGMIKVSVPASSISTFIFTP